jgi:DNA-binding response OmpR family regulator
MSRARFTDPQPGATPDATPDAVLVVESDRAQREALGRLLRAEGHVVVEAGSAEAGLDVLRTRGNDAEGAAFSLVVVGEGPLGRTGTLLLRGMALHQGPPTPALVLTTSESFCETAGVTFGLRKPFQVEELLSRVGHFQRRRRPD